MIIYQRFLKINSSNSYEKFRKYLKEKSNNSNLNFVQRMIDNTKIEIKDDSMIDIDIIILVKLIEFHLLKKYSKDLKQIIEKTNAMNISDYIVKNLFLFETVYDDIKLIYTNFKEKIYWNFGEILLNVYSNFPKILKKTLFRHLQYIPEQESLVYHIIQYYYSNKDYRKTKILIRKVIMSEDKSELIFDIHTICLIMIVNILINDEKYGEALELAIYNLERLKEKSNLASQILARAYFMLGFCYSKLGDNTTSYEEKTKYSELALSSFKFSQEIDTNNTVFTYYLARQYYELKLYSAANKILILVENDKTNRSNIYNHLIYSLRILINIAELKFEEALNLCEYVLKNNFSEILRFNIVIILKFYLLIMKLINSSNNQFEEILIKKIIDFLNIIFEALDEETKSAELSIDKIGNIKSNKNDKSVSPGRVVNQKVEFSNKQLHLKEIAKFSEFEPYFKETLYDKDLKNSPKVFYNEKKNLENLKIEIIKNFYLLVDILHENGFEKSKKIDDTLNSLYLKANFLNLNEDVNLLLIKAIQLQFEKKESEAENIYIKILEINPSNMIVLKRLSKLLLAKNDFSNAYIYINKAIKLDEEESELWNLLSLYYIKNGDNAKYYECVLKELEKSKFHTNSFLIGLTPKVII